MVGLVVALGGNGGGLGDLPVVLLRPPSVTLPANSLNVLAACLFGLFNLKLSSRGKDIFILSTRLSSRDVCITNSSNNVGLIGVVERGLSIGIVLTSCSRCFTGKIGTATLFSKGKVVGI